MARSLIKQGKERGRIFFWNKKLKKDYFKMLHYLRYEVK